MQASIDSISTFNNTVTDNYGAVLKLDDTSRAVVTRSNISNSTAQLGGAVFVTRNASLFISDSIIRANKAMPDDYSGGGAIFASHFAKVANC